MTPEKIKSAINLFKSGDKQAAKQLLLEIIKSDPQNETGWLWLSACVDTIDQKKYCLEKVLAINPNNLDAQKAVLSLQNRQQVSTAKEKTPSNDSGSSAYKSSPPIRQSQTSSPKPNNAKSTKPINTPLLLGGIVLFLICIIGAVLLGVNASSFFNALGNGSNPIFPIQATSTSAPTISDDKISTEILDYYGNTLEISLDLTSMGMGIVPIPAKDFFQATNIRVVDKSISGNEATIIARINFTIIDMPPYGSGNWDALLKYFGGLELRQAFEQERKFLFQQYESGAWRLEKELNTEVP
jgi:hypothetical protein